MMSWITAHGGLIGAVLLIVAIANIVLSALASVLNALKMSEPGWLQTIVSVLAKVADWLSANVQHPPK